MGKRSDFERIPRDNYPTPYDGIVPLLPHLDDRTLYTEPCVGDGELVKHLARHGHECVMSFDHEEDARTTVSGYGQCYITNPPWDRKILHPIINNLSSQMPTWLLFDADWLHTKQSAPFMDRLVKVVSIGRLKWIPGSKMTGKDNCCWYLFDALFDGQTQFFGRV